MGVVTDAKGDAILRDPRRRKVNRLLGSAGPGLQQLYRDGCRVVDDVVVLETAVNVIGNCARETESGVREVLAEITLEHSDTPPCTDKCLRCGSKIRHVGHSHHDEILAILGALKVDASDIADLWFGLTDLSSITHRRGLERARPLTSGHRATWRRLEDLLAIVLPHLESRLLAVLPKYRQLADIASPTKADLKAFRRLPNVYRGRREFMEKATPAWFPLLDKAGIFDQTEDAFAWEPTEGALVPQHWPATDYLVRMSALAEHQERFVAIFERIDPPHEWALNDLVKAAKDLPIELSRRCTQPLRRWIERQPYIFLAGRTIGEFAAALAAGGKAADGVELLRVLLATTPDPRVAETRDMQEEALFSPIPTTRLREHEYDLVVKHGLIELARADPVGGFPLTVELLDQALANSERRDAVAKRRDSSLWWRQSIAHGGRSHSHKEANVLVDAVVAAAEARLSRTPATLSEVLEELESRDWTLCRRIALHVLAEHPNPASIRERLLDTTLVERGGSWPEFRALLASNFAKLDPESQRQYVDLVEAYRGDGADPDFTGGVEHREWVLRRLRPIADLLARDVRDRYPELASRARPEGSSDETEVRVISGWVGNKAQVPPDEMRDLSDDALIAHVRDWVPPGTLGGPTIEGQAEALHKAIAAEPIRFAAIAMRFQDLDCTYVRALFNGLYDGLHGDPPVTFEWKPVLDLASWVVAQPQMPARSSWSQDPDWTWTRKAIAELLDEGLNSQVGSIPLEHADQVWSLVTVLADNADAPTPRGTDTPDERADEEDALSAALNSTRGKALDAAISFAYWRSSRTGEAQQAIGAVPAVSEFLARHLDHREDRSLAARGVFGSRLTRLVALDADWVKQHLGLLFPHEDDLVRRLTWQAYVLWSHPYTNVRVILTDEYRAAIDRLHVPTGRSRLDVGEKLADHLMLFYLYGDIDLNSADGLVEAFYRRAPAAVRGQATEILGRVLYDNPKGIKAEDCDRLRRLWEWRRSAAVDLPQPEQRAEFENFGWWFSSDACDQDWLLDELIRTLRVAGSIENDSLVMEKLVKLAPAHPGEVIDVVELMIESPKERWLVQVWIDDIVAIVGATLGTTAHPRARALGARLVADGFDSGLIALLSPPDQSI